MPDPHDSRLTLALCLTLVTCLLAFSSAEAQVNQTEALSPPPPARLVRDLVEEPVRMCSPGSSNETMGIGAVPRASEVLNGRLMFHSFVNGSGRIEILSTDGSFDGTELIANTCFSDCAEPILLGKAGKLLLYGRSEGLFQSDRAARLWWTDGNDEGTSSTSLPSGFDYVRSVGSDGNQVWVTSRPVSGTPYPFVSLKPGATPTEVGEANSSVLFGGGIPFGSGVAVGDASGLLHFLDDDRVASLDSSCGADQLLQETNHGLLMKGACPDPTSNDYNYGIFELDLTGPRFLLPLLSPTPIGVPLPPDAIAYPVGAVPGTANRAYVAFFGPETNTLYTWSESNRNLQVLAEGPVFQPAYDDGNLLLATVYDPQEELPYELRRIHKNGTTTLLTKSKVRPFGFSRIGEVIAFYSQDLEYGGELWVTDGTAEATYVVWDNEPGPGGFQDSPYLQCNQPDFMAPTQLNQDVFFAAYREDTGIELFALPTINFVGGEGPEPDPCEQTGNLCLHDDRFRVTLAWETASETGAANVVNFQTDDSGLFWFFGEDNWEVMVKVLDGCVVNDHYWVLAAGTTDVAYRLEVFDTETNTVWMADNPLGTASPAQIDVTAFGGCSAP